MIERSKVVEREIRSLESVLATLELEVALLSPAKPDPDYVDELARDILGFARANDQILMGALARR